MKTVFTNDMVAHVWNAQTQSTGRSANGNFYFIGTQLFSYRDSWIVAKIMDDRVALLNADTYSPSTSRHTRYAWRAINNRTTYQVAGLNELLRNGIESPYVQKHLLENAHAMNDGTAVYLLERAGQKNPADKWTKIKAERARLDQAEKDRKAKNKLDAALCDAADVASMDDAQVNEYLARACNSTHGLKNTATKLFHAHRAAKKRKRNVQASRVYEILLLARKIIKLDEVRARVRARRQSFTGNRKHFESALARINSADVVTLRMLDDASTYGPRLLDYVPKSKTNAHDSIMRLVNAAEYEKHEVREKENAAELARTRAQMAAWLEGDRTARVHYTFGGTLLRALDVTRDESGAIIGGTLQTSRNAEVPLVHAVRAFRFVKLCKEKARTWTRNGHSLRVGHFTVDHIAANGDFTAGCHHIKWNEVERVARLLGVFDSVATDDALTPSQTAA